MKSAQRQFLVKVEGIEGYFMTKSGGNLTSDTNKVYDGGSVRPDVISSPAESDDVTVSRGYDPYRDAPILASLRQAVGRYRTTVSITPTDEDLVPVTGDDVAEVFPEALLVGLNSPDVDAGSGDAAVFELVFAIAGWK